MVTTPEHTGWVCSERVGGAIDQRRESTHRRRRSACRGGGEEEPRGGLPYFQSSPAFRPQMFLQNSLGDLNSLANLGRSWSLMSPKSKHLRRLLLSAALLTLLPCLELTIIAHQPLAKTYSMVVTVAVCPHKATTTVQVRPYWPDSPHLKFLSIITSTMILYNTYTY